MMSLASELHRNIRSQNLFNQGEKLLVTVSGGSDSVALLHLLHRLSIKTEWRLVVAHFNHQLRGRESGQDETFVANLASSLDLPFEVERGNVSGYSKAKKISVEMGARILRHEFFCRAAAVHQTKKIVLAHTLDDQLELFLLRMLRGAGEGLTAMYWFNASFVDNNIMLTRPFLSFSKTELKNFLLQKKLSWIEDSSNLDLNIKRNWVRHQLIPLLEQGFPGFQGALSKTVEILREEKRLIQNLAEAEMLRDSFNIYQAPVAIQREIIKTGLRRCGVVEKFDRVEILRLSRNKAVALGPDIFFELNEKGGLMRAKDPSKKPGFTTTDRCHAMDLRGRHGLSNFDGLRIEWKVEAQPTKPSGPRASGVCEEYFDAEKLGKKVFVRHWQKGDRYQPMGMQKQVKLQDYFVNNKIPRARRHELAVATTAKGEIFWVEDCRISELFKLDKCSSQRLKWAWYRD